MKTPKAKIPEGWRRLRAGEKIKAGDKFWFGAVGAPGRTNYWRLQSRRHINAIGERYNAKDYVTHIRKT